MSKGKKWRKGKYKVINWGAYNKKLKKRGDLTIWFTQEGIEKWLEEEASVKFRGRQREYSDTAIQAIYFHYHLISMPFICYFPLLLFDYFFKLFAKFVAPAPNSFVTDINSSI